MREIIDEINAWLDSGKSVAIATNVRKEGSTLRPLGAKMAMTNTGQIAGSVSGGCIEGTVYEEAQKVIATGIPRLMHFAAAKDEDPFDIGLSCGGMLDVLVEPFNNEKWQEIYPALETCLAQKDFVSIVTSISKANLGKKILVWPDGKFMGSLGNENHDKKAVLYAQAQMRNRQSGWTNLGDLEVFVDVFAPPARLIVIGAVHISIPLVSMAKVLGFKTIVIDPRKTFAKHERFPRIDELIIEWPAEAIRKLNPDENTYIVALSHDEKIDNPALAVALASSARYVGVLGAKKNVHKRIKELRNLDVSEENIKKLHAPTGLNIGSITTEEIALSILAEIVAEKYRIKK